jgi:cysteine desulfuration protein SufE
LERYQYLIDLGRQLPAMDAALKVPENLVEGCQSQVWLSSRGNADLLEFVANSDSTIVSGLIALMLRVYSGRPAQEILDTPADFIEAVGLGRHLSATRSNGLGAMLARVRQTAESALNTTAG